MAYDETNRGALFKNEQKEADKHPDYKGKINIEGVDFWLSAWLKTAESGRKYMSLSVQPKEQKATPPAPAPRRNSPGSAAHLGSANGKSGAGFDDMDDDIPW